MRARALAVVVAAAAASLVASVAPREAQAATTWDERYESARAVLVAGEYGDALVQFEWLARDATTPTQRAVAEEMAEVCRMTILRRSAATQRYLADTRTDEEMRLLYGHAFLYGLGTASWFILETDPGTVPAAILPFAGFTIGAVGGVAAIDHYHRFARGVPYAISAGLYLGFGEGVWVVAYQKERSFRIRDATGHDPSWDSTVTSTVMWAGATSGAAVGALVGSARHPTSGRVSFTASTTIWSGALGALATGALVPYHVTRRGEDAFAVGGAAYNAGLAAGLLLGPRVNPSVAHVRFTDLGGLAGGLLAAGGYLLGAGSKADQRAALGAAAIGGAAGLSLTWVATAGLDRDDEGGSAPPPPASLAATLHTMQPILTPVSPGGAQIGVAGAL